jgi:hypothetical protein
MKTVLDTLISTRAKIEDPKTWCQGVLARDSAGGEVPVGAQEACQWCALGALYSQSQADGRYLESGLYLESLRTLAKASELTTGVLDIAVLNDHPDKSSHQTILSVFDRAISLATSRGI